MRRGCGGASGGGFSFCFPRLLNHLSRRHARNPPPPHPPSPPPASSPLLSLPPQIPGDAAPGLLPELPARRPLRCYTLTCRPRLGHAYHLRRHTPCPAGGDLRSCDHLHRLHPPLSSLHRLLPLYSLCRRFLLNRHYQLPWLAPPGWRLLLLLLLVVVVVREMPASFEQSKHWLQQKRSNEKRSSEP
jgi:hypothetical protein